MFKIFSSNNIWPYWQVWGLPGFMPHKQARRFRMNSQCCCFFLHKWRWCWGLLCLPTACMASCLPWGVVSLLPTNIWERFTVQSQLAESTTALWWFSLKTNYLSGRWWASPHVLTWEPPEVFNHHIAESLLCYELKCLKLPYKRK